MLKVVTFFFLTVLQSLPGSAVFKVIPMNRKTYELFRGNLKVTESCWLRYLGCFSLNRTIWILSAAHTSQLYSLQKGCFLLFYFLHLYCLYSIAESDCEQLQNCGNNLETA